MKWIVFFIAVLVVLVGLWIAISARKERAEEAISYVCDACGESDCECRKEE